MTGKNQTPEYFNYSDFPDITVDYIDVTTPGKALVTKVLTGSTLTSTWSGVDQGTGTVTINLPTILTSGTVGVSLSSVIVDAYGRVVSGTPGTGPTLPIATSSVLGGIKVGSGLGVDVDGTLYVTAGGASYTLPIASGSVLGGVKVGTGLSIDGSGILSATGSGSGTVTSVGLSITTGPITVSGSPVTTTGTLALTWSGTSSNFVRGDGSSISTSSYALVSSLSSYLTTAVAASTYQPLNSKLTTYAALSVPGTSGYVLSSDTSGNLTWVGNGAGSVTSVGLTAPSIFTVSGSPVTGSGSLSFAWNGASTNLVRADGSTVAQSTFLTANQSITWTGSGDVSGTASGTTSISPSVTVTGIQGKAITLAAGFLKYNGSAWVSDASTYLTANQSITLSGDVSGTGTTSISVSVNKILGNTVPANASGVLTNNGSGVLSWTAAGGGGTVTSIGMTVAGPLSVTPASITTSGTFAVTWSGASTSFVNADGSTTTHATYAAIASPTFTGTVTTPALTLSGFTTGTLINTSGVVSALSGTNIVLGNGTTIAQSTFQSANANLTVVAGYSSITNLTSLVGLANPGSTSHLQITSGGAMSWDTSTYLTANQSITLSGAVTGTGTTAITTSFGASPTFSGTITLASLNGTLIGTSGVVSALSGTNIVLGNGTTIPQSTFLTTAPTITLTGNVTGTGTGSFATTIAASAVTLAMQANLAANSVIGNLTGSSATPVAVSAVATATASSVAVRDSNANLTAVNVLEGYTTTVTSASAVVLTVASNYQQYFTGSTAQTVTLPVTSTLVLGQSWYIQNQSTAQLTIQSSGANTVIALAAGTSATVTCILTSGTTAASWSYVYNGFNFSSGTRLTLLSILSFTGTNNTQMTFPTTNATLARTDAAQTFTGTQTFSSVPTLASLTTAGVLLNNGSGVVSSTATTSSFFVMGDGSVVATSTYLTTATAASTYQPLAANLTTLGALGNPASNGYVLSSTTAGVMSWIPVSGGGGTVTSVGLAAPSIFTVTGSPVATTGTLTFAFNGSATSFLNADGSTTSHATYATVASPTFTGTVTTPAITVSGISSAGVVQTTSSGVLSALASPGTSGWVLSSTTAGVLSWVAQSGGMANPMTTTGDMIYSSSGSTPARLAVGTSSQVLVGGTTPAWSGSPTLTGLTLSGLTTGTVIATSGVLSTLSGTNLVLGNGTTIAQSTFQAASANLTTVAGYAALTNLTNLTGLANPASTSHLQITSSGTMSWDTATYLTTGTASTTYAVIASPTFTGTVTTPALTLSGFTTGTLINTSGVVSALSGTNLVLGNGTTIPQSTFLTTAPTITLTGNVTGTGTGSFATTISAGVVTLAMQAVLAANSVIGNLTGSSATPAAVAATTTATASSVAVRDANANLTAANHLQGYTTTTASGTTYTLTVASNYQQYITGSTTQLVTLPVASTLVVGQAFWFQNSSTGAVTVQSSGANTVCVIASGASALVTCVLASGTTAASWSYVYAGAVTVSGKLVTFNNTLTFTGTDSTTITTPTTSAVMARTDAAQTFTGTQTFSSAPTFSSLTTAGVLLNNGSGVVSSSAGSSANFINADGSTTAHSLYATIASPTFTGTVTTPALTLSGFTTGTLINTSGVVSTLSGTNLVLGNGTTIAQSTFATSASPTFTGTVTTPALTVSGFTTAGVVQTTSSGVLSALASPGTNGWVLSSTTAGVLSWIAPGAFTGGTLTSNLTLMVGTTGTAPLTLQSGTNLTTAVAGSVEWNGTNLFVTSTGPTRNAVAWNPTTTTGDLIYASSTATPAALSRLAIVAAGSVLVSGTTPAWSASPTLTGLTLSGLGTGTVIATSGVLSALSGTNLVLASGSTITQATFATVASPTFTGTVTTPALTLSGFTTGTLINTSGVISALSGTNLVLGNGTTIAQSTFQAANANLTTVAGYTALTNLTSLTGLANPGSTSHLQITSGGVMSWDTATYLTTGTASTTYAPIASPSFTGTVTLPTGLSGALIATAGVVSNVVNNTSSYFVLGNGGTVAISTYLTTSTASTTYAPIASPTFTGTATTPSLTVSLLTTAGVLKNNGSGVISSTASTSSNFVKGDGSLDSSTYLTANQSITLTGAVTGTGTTAITTSYGTIVANSVIANTTGSTAVPTATSLVTTATASSVALRDANANLSMVNALEGYTTTATAGTTTTLTVSSNYNQFFTGSTTQTVQMPVVTGLVLGQSWYIQNSSTGLVTINSSGSNAILVLAANTAAIIQCILLTGTTAASWSYSYIANLVASGKKLTVNNSVTFTGTDGVTITLPASNATMARTDTAQTFTGTQTFLSVPTFSSLTTAGVLLNSSSGVVSSSAGLATNFLNADGSTTAHALYATIASPTFTGTVTTPAITVSGFTTAGVVQTSSSGVLSALASPGTNGYILSSTTAGVLSWIAPGSGGMTNPMTTTGDMIYSSSGTTPARLAVGTSSQVLIGGTIPAWSSSLTLGGKLTLPASTTGSAYLNTPLGSVPTSPVDGDHWTTTAGEFVQISGATVKLNANGALYYSSSAAVTVANTTTNTAIMSTSLVSSAQSPGNVVQVIGDGIIAYNSLSDTITVTIVLGSVTMGTFTVAGSSIPSGATATNYHWKINGRLSPQTAIGSTATVDFFGTFEVVGSGASYVTDMFLSSTVNTTISNALNVNVQWSAASTGDTLTANYMTAAQINSIGGGGGAVLSVGLTAPGIFTVTGSPVTSSGNLTFAWNGASTAWVKGDGSTTTSTLLTNFSGLSNPTTAGYTLSSDTSGNLSWTAPSALSYWTTGAVVTVSNTTTTTSLISGIAPFAVAAQNLGNVINITLDGTVEFAALSNYVTWTWVIGTTTIVTHTLVGTDISSAVINTAYQWSFNGRLVPQSANGTSATVALIGTLLIYATNDVVTIAVNSSATLNTTIQNTLNVTVQWNAAASTNTLVCNDANVVQVSSVTGAITGPQGPSGSGMANPMTTVGDLIYGGSAGVPTRLAVGSTGTILIGGTTPTWSSSPTFSGQAGSPNFIDGYTTTVTSGTTVTLTAASTYLQYFTGSTAQTVTMPVTSTLPMVLGQSWCIENNGTAAITVNSSGANLILTIASGCSATLTCISLTLNTAAAWSYIYTADVVASGKKLTTNNSLTLAGTDSTTMTFPGTSASIARIDAAQTFTGTQTFLSVPTLSSLTTAGVLLNSASGVVSSSAGSATNFINADGSTTAHALYATIASPTFTGTVTTPAFTLSGFTTGILKNTSGVVGTATAGTDYFGVPAGTTSQILSGTGSVLSTLPTSALPTFTGDVAFASLATTVNGLKGNTIPTLATGYLNWTGSAWAFSAGGMTNPMTTTGDMIYSSSGSTPARLAAVATGSVLASAGTGTAPTWNTNPVLTCIGETVQTVAVSTTPAVNCANGNNVIIGTTGVVGALTAATTITFSNVVVGTTTKVRIKQGTTSFAITLTISGYTFYGNGQTAGLASGGTPAQLAAGNMTLSQFYTIEILWATATVAYVSLLKT